MKNLIKDLKIKWVKENELYKKQEVGSGVHSFVKDFLESEDLFRLKEGRLSGKDVLRKNEYIHENKAKEGRKADFVIYISPEIVVPLEAECYGNIQAGIKQLINYQKDFDKHYGILTDGYTWRFYNNNLYREFNLDQIINETNIFLEFWKEYIKPEFYYLTFFEPQGQLSLLKEERLPVEENRQIFFNDITKLIRSFKNKLQVEGYFEGLDRKDREKKAVEITYAYVIQFILYKTLVDNEFDNFVQEFKEIVKAIHDCLKVKQYGKILGVIEGISNKISQNIYRPFKKEQDFINQILLNLYRQPKNELHDVAPWLDIFVFIKKYTFANIQNEIFGYIYENYLKELYEDTKKGQYFTDPAIVNFMLQQVGFTPEALQKRYQYDKDSISLIDPSCGSGTFLYSAVDSILKAFGNNSEEKSKHIEAIVNNNIFGLDIAEFPLYLAEMNILMRMLPLIINEKYNNPIDKKIKVFLTKDSVSEFMDTALRNTFNDQTVEFQKKAKSPNQIPLFTQKLDLGYKSYVREESDLEEMKRSLENQPECPRRRFDFVIGNPPYIGYNECSKQEVLIMKLIQNKKVQMSDIYGVNLNTVPGRIKPYSPKPNLYAFFIALGVALLKDNGRLCYIIPQTVLTAGDLDVLRYHLAKFTTIKKIITFSGKMFIGRGLKQDKPVATSSLIFVLNRKIPFILHKVEIINYTDPNDTVEQTLKNILIGKKISRKLILQNKLFQSVANWNFIKQSKKYLDFYEVYNQDTIDISSFRVQLKPEEDFSFDGGVIIDTNKIVSNYESNYFEIFDYKNNNWSFYTVSRSSNYYSKKSPFSFPAGSQGIATFLKKFKIIWRTRFTSHFQFTDRPILLINNQSLTVSSNSEKELLFYFALLNSPINKLIFEKSLKQENERDYFIPLKAVKSLVRIPIVNENNRHIKNEVIKRVMELFILEKNTLSDYVDFSKVMVQKLDSIMTKSGSLFLRKEGKEIKLQIKDNLNLIKKIIDSNYVNQKLDLEGKQILLADLKSQPIIDLDKQRALKDYIDDLVFSLYFKIIIPKNKLSNLTYIKDLCSKNKFYKLIS